VTCAIPTPRKFAVERIGEVLAVGVAKRGRAASVNATAAQLFHESPHRQLLGNGVFGVPLAARIERQPALVQHQGGQGTIEELQADLDAWLAYYNNERTHQGKMCCGRTPMQPLLDGKKAWRDKITALNSRI